MTTVTFIPFIPVGYGDNLEFGGGIPVIPEIIPDPMDEIETMTVAELIERLQQFPPDMPVVTHDGEYNDSFCAVDVFQKQLWGREVVKITPMDDERHWGAQIKTRQGSHKGSAEGA